MKKKNTHRVYRKVPAAVACGYKIKYALEPFHMCSVHFFSSLIFFFFIINIKTGACVSHKFLGAHTADAHVCTTVKCTK